MIIRTYAYDAMMSSSFSVREEKERKKNQYVWCYDLIINITSKYKRRKKNLNFFTPVWRFLLFKIKTMFASVFLLSSQSSMFGGFAPPRSIFQDLFLCVWYHGVWSLSVSCSRMIVNEGWWEWDPKIIFLTLGRRWQWIKEQKYILCVVWKNLSFMKRRKEKELKERA